MSKQEAAAYTFEGHLIRTVRLHGTTWFIAADVCRVLGLQDVQKALKCLNVDEFARNSIRGFRGNGEINCISEAGLNRLVMRSDKPQARPFQDWVCRVVLPAIRKDGMYVAGEEKLATGEMSDDELTLMVMERLRSKIDRLASERDEARRGRDEKAAIIERELETLTTDEFRALNHFYWSHAEKVRFGQWATSLCRARRIEMGSQERRPVAVPRHPLPNTPDSVPAKRSHFRRTSRKRSGSTPRR